MVQERQSINQSDVDFQLCYHYLADEIKADVKGIVYLLDIHFVALHQSLLIC